MTIESSRLEKALSVVLTACTLVAVVILVEGRFRRASRQDGGSRVEKLKNWSSTIERVGAPITPLGAIVKVAVFTDFECPYCRALDSALLAMESLHPGRMERQVIHFPLRGHSFARRAAAAFECASAQGMARRMHDHLYRVQPAFDQLDWSALGAAIELRNPEAFDMCMADSSRSARIDSGVKLARELKLSGTPVVVVNDWLFDPASAESVERAVTAVMAGRSPKP